ncbi:MAG: hypothetical protein ACREK4_23600, partial [Candidatus Rokuibacteriota bacterium]
MNRTQSPIARAVFWTASVLLLGLMLGALAAPPALAATPQGGGEANLIVPDLGSVAVGGMNGRLLLMV